MDERAAAIAAFYALGLERDRLNEGAGALERIRTQQILERHLPGAPATVLDVGGAAGAYAFWLAERGYQVHLLDPVPLHLAQARTQNTSAAPLASIRGGDARRLDFATSSADAVLLLGPLYHLLERSDRLQALREARRVVRSGGRLAAAAISRYAGLIDGLRGAIYERDHYLERARRAITTGRHENLSGDPRDFTHAYLHTPDELEAEISAAGLLVDALLAVEGPAAATPDLAAILTDDHRRTRLLAALDLIETERPLLAASPHILAIATRP